MVLKVIAVGGVLTAVLSIYFSWQTDDFKEEMVSGKRVLVTGASSGVGRAVALRYCELGAHVYIIARRENKLREVIAECRKIAPNNKFGYMKADMSNMSMTSEVIKNAVAALDGLDILFLNHAYIPDAQAYTPEQNLKKYDLMQRINTQSFVFLTGHAFEHLKKSHGHIFVVGSTSSKVPAGNLIEYCANKFALDGYFAALREDLLAQDIPITVGHAILGWTDTELAKSVSGELGFEPPAGFNSPRNCANTLIRGAALRHRDVWSVHPHWHTYMVRLYSFLPEWVITYGV